MRGLLGAQGFGDGNKGAHCDVLGALAPVSSNSPVVRVRGKAPPADTVIQGPGEFRHEGAVLPSEAGVVVPLGPDVVKALHPFGQVEGSQVLDVVHGTPVAHPRGADDKAARLSRAFPAHYLGSRAGYIARCSPGSHPLRCARVPGLECSSPRGAAWRDDTRGIAEGRALPAIDAGPSLPSRGRTGRPSPCVSPGPAGGARRVKSQPRKEAGLLVPLLRTGEPPPSSEVRP